MLRAELSQPIVLLALARDGGDFVAKLREDRDGDRADAAGRAGDDDRPAVGPDAAIDDRADALCGGEAGGAVDHRVAKR